MTVLLVRIVGARIPDRYGPYRAASAATALTATGLTVIAAVPRPAGLFAGTVVFSLGMSLLYPAMITLALTGVPETERGSVIGTVASFFDGSQGVGAALLGGLAALGGYRIAFLGAALLALAALALLRSGIDPRTRAPIDHDAARQVPCP